VGKLCRSTQPSISVHNYISTKNGCCVTMINTITRHILHNVGATGETFLNKHQAGVEIMSNSGVVLLIISTTADRQYLGRPHTCFKPNCLDLQILSIAIF